MANIQATNNFVFIIKDEEQSESNGLIIPGSSREKTNTGTIFSVGDLVQDKKIKNGKGKKCMFHKGIGFSIEYEQTEYLVLAGEEVIAVL